MHLKCLGSRVFCHDGNRLDRIFGKRLDIHGPQDVQGYTDDLDTASSKEEGQPKGEHFPRSSCCSKNDILVTSYGLDHLALPEAWRLA